MERRLFVLLAIVAVCFSALAPMAVVAQSDAGNTATTTPLAGDQPTETPTATAAPTPAETPTQTPAEAATETPTRGGQTAPPADRVTTGEYDIAELREGGISQNVDNVESVRALGDPPQGFAALRYRDPTLLDAIFGSPGTWQQVDDSVVHVNELQLYGSAFGEVSGGYELVVTFWQPKNVATGNGTVTVAANQSVNRYDVTYSEEDLYSYHNISIPEHLDSTWEATAWLERGGEKQEGVQWRFDHRSNPESSAVNINSQSGAWGFTFRYAIIPGVIGLIAGFAGARAAIRKTGRGPGYGVGSWLLVLTIVSVMVGITGYYQIAVILKNAPYVMGGSFLVISFAAGLTFHQPVKYIGFLRRELMDVESIPGGSVLTGPKENGEAATDGGQTPFNFEDNGAEVFEEFTEAIYLDLPEVPAVRTDDGYRVPVTGLRPFLARFFADAALLDMTNIATRQKVKQGRLDDLITVDPKAGPAVEHKPARIVRVLPWDTLAEDAETKDTIVAAVMTLAIVALPAAAGFFLFDAILNIPSVGVLLGAIATALMAYSAEDGWIEFTAAPPHYVRAEDSLTVLQRAYKESADVADAKSEVYEERSKTASEARDEQMSEVDIVSERILDAMGAGDALDGEPDGGDGHDGDRV